MTPLPVVTILIPARNEEADIKDCLRCVAAQDYPLNRIEVIVVDGASTDATAEIVRKILGRGGFASTAVLNNPTATTPSNLNVGLAAATGDILCRVDARTRIERHHVRTCVEALTQHQGIAVVGGAQIAVARDGSARSRGIARALNNRYSMGGSPYRRSRASGPSDTVYLGAFRREDLVAVGGWNDRLATNQDFDLNRRMAERGQVWFEATLRSGYVPRSSLPLLWRQYRRFGRAKVRYWRLTSTAPNGRQMLMLGLPVVAAVVGGIVVRLAGIGPALATATVGAAALDVSGSTDPAPLRVRAVALGASLAVAAGWWTGVVAELVGPDRT